MIASLSISGVPPLNGFWSKLIIIVACVQAGRYTFAVCAVVGSILTLSSFMKVQRYVFMGYLKDTLSDIKEVPLAMTLPMLVLAAFCIFAGVLLLSDSEGNILMLALDAVLRGKEYGSMVMGLLQ
jgi:formate hydrogenlyase subunit 3/multisubunit Na+/H+ antiporter MnhD subunit